MDRKLKFELIPDGCFKYNLRNILSKTEWDYIKKVVKASANGTCMICGKKTYRLDAHERWSYNEKDGIIKLEDVLAVCTDCHAVIHINRTFIKGDEERAEKHYRKVNACTYAEYRRDLGLANEEQKRRNNVAEWKMDLSNLLKFVKE